MLGLHDGLIKLVGFAAAYFVGIGPRGDPGRFANPGGDRWTDAAERSGEKLRQRAGRRVLEHRDKQAQFDAVRMRLDLLRLRRQRVGRSHVRLLFAVRVLVVQRDVRVGDGRLLQVFVDAAAAPVILGFQLDRHSRAVIQVDPFDAMLRDILRPLFARRNVVAFAPAVENLGKVLLRVDLNFVVVGRLALRDLGNDLHWLAGREHAVHAGRADADPLLAAAHPQAMELRAVQQLAEDQWDLLFQNARAVVLHADFETVRTGRLDMDPYLGQDAGFFAGVQRVVDRLFDRREQRLAGIVEAQQMAVLGKELADRDIALTGGHRFGPWPGAVCRRG